MARSVRGWVVVLVLGVVGSAGVLWAEGPADQQFGFAEQLLGSGDGQLAILEFRRFQFFFPDDPRVPDASVAVARADLEYLGDVAAARRELAGVLEQYPQSPAAQHARRLDGMIEAHKDFGYQPLVLFTTSVGARARGDVATALDRLGALLRSFPASSLAPEAAFLRADILEDEKRLDEAIAAYGELPARYPRSPLAARALLGQATATEARDGAAANVVGLYQQIIQRYPRTPEAAAAYERLAALQGRGGPRPPAPSYKIVKSSYNGTRRRTESFIELPEGATAGQVRAALGDMLARLLKENPNRTWPVIIEARIARMRDLAGTLTWARHKKAVVDVKLGEPERGPGQPLVEDLFR